MLTSNSQCKELKFHIEFALVKRQQWIHFLDMEINVEDQLKNAQYNNKANV